jgi:alpha-amylase/alpha-mannosidase (GH57 family)
MGKKPLCIALLWHMHQPDYGNVQTGEIYLPWTRFHAIKDYYDMGALVEAVPALRLTINVVPSLIDQLTAYSSGAARETYAALTLKNAAELNRFEQQFLLRSFFQLTWKEMVDPHPRYRELLDRRGATHEQQDYSEAARRFGTQDFRDLQVWFNLAWCGRELNRDPEIAALIQKGRNFTEDDKKRLLEIQYAFIGRILPYYRQLMDRQGIEISVSPYYHPILPLLCDNRSAREALPGIALPENPFSYPNDAREHITSAVRRYVEIFGRAPRGMWPSEGSVSNAALQLARESGLRWLATDEAILLNSLQKMGLAAGGLTMEQRYRAHRVGTDPAAPCLFFRDHGLSDLIGFTYSRWKAQDAANDFISKLQQIHNHLPDDGRHYVVPVILDGENAWEHYPENGVEFLTMLYRGLTGTKWIRTVTFSDYLDLEPVTDTLPSVVAGSWIYGNLATWIGHPEKNRAWDALSTARSFLGQRMQSGEPRSTEAFREFMIAEGSDWFWWYGDDHQTENAAEFDSLFRTHVKNVYRLLAQPYPPELDTPIKRTETRTQFRDPVHTITPHIDGRVTDYFEWIAAGWAIPAGGESMHRTDRYFERLYFGYDARHFYVRLDLVTDRGQAVASPGSYQLYFTAPKECVFLMERTEAGEWQLKTVRGAGPNLAPAFAGDRILEIAVPLEALGVSKPDHVRFFASALDKGIELERFPRSDYITVAVDPWGLDHREWIV